MKHYLALDLGGTFAKMGLLDERGKVLFREEVPVSKDGYQTPILDTVTKALNSFLEREKIQKEKLSGIGVAACGQIDSQRGVVVGTCGTIPGWTGTSIKGRLEKEYGLPVSVMNDANAMCLGECLLGGGKGYSDVIGITYGTGIGGGIFSQGKLLEGSLGLAGELGHFPTHAGEGVRCTCGSLGCYEQYASVTALMKKAKGVNGTWLDAKEVFASAEAGNKEASVLLDSWINEVALGLVGLVHIFNPQLILIGGGVSSQEKLFIEPLRKKVLSSVMPAFGKTLKLEKAMLGNDAGMVGAFCYLKSQLEG